MVVEEEDNMLALLLKILVRQLTHGGMRKLSSRREGGLHAGAAAENTVTSVKI